MKKVFLVTYDLCNVKKYKEIYDHINSYQEHYQLTASSYLITTSNKSSEDVMNEFKSHLDSDDKIFVVKITSSDFSYCNISFKTPSTFLGSVWDNF